MSDFTKETCAACGGECFAVSDGICQECYLKRDVAHHSLHDPGEVFGSKIDDAIAGLWKVIRMQGDRIKALEDKVRAQS